VGRWIIGKRNGRKIHNATCNQSCCHGFPVAVGCHGAIELTLQLSQVNAVAGQFMKVAVQPVPLLGIVVIWTNLPEIRAFLRTVRHFNMRQNKVQTKTAGLF
jgi:hypothetical protein